MLKSLQSYMYIGQNQRKGIALTCLFILSYAIFKHYYVRYHFKPLPEIVITDDTKTPSQEIAGIANFDLNEAGVEQLKNIGIPETLAARMINFRNKIDGFKSWDKVAKVYGLTTDQLDVLKKHTYLDVNDPGAGNNYEFKKHSFKSQDHYKNNELKPIKMASFDPNNVTSGELLQMGIPEKIAKGIVNFRKAGFTYKSTEDLKKIYSMNDATFDKIAPFVAIKSGPSSSTAIQTEGKKAFKNRIIPVDINSATMEQLDALPGIGPGYANKILNWRNKLGGFHDLAQISATYNLPDTVFEKIKPYILFNTPPIRININQCDEKALAQHFYIQSKEAKILIAYRGNHGPYKSVDDLMKVGAVDKAWIEKVGPYLSFE